jgi:hypothetical protein
MGVSMGARALEPLTDQLQKQLIPALGRDERGRNAY